MPFLHNRRRIIQILWQHVLLRESASASLSGIGPTNIPGFLTLSLGKVLPVPGMKIMQRSLPIQVSCLRLAVLRLQLLHLPDNQPLRRPRRHLVVVVLPRVSLIGVNAAVVDGLEEQLVQVDTVARISMTIIRSVSEWLQYLP